MKSPAGLLAAAAVAVSFLLPGTASGQAHVGPQLSLAEDRELGLGGRVLVNLSDFEGWEGVGSFDLFFPDGDVDYWELNGNVLYNFPVEPSRSFFPYLGGGINIARLDARGMDAGDTAVGLNVVGGGKFDAAGVTPFVEARIEVEGGEQFVFTGGLLFP